MRARQLGWVEPPTDVPRIASRLAALLADWRAGRLPSELPPPQGDDARERTEALAALLARASAFDRSAADR